MVMIYMFERGFVLIELIMALTLMGLLFTTVTPVFSFLNNSELNAAIDEIVFTLRWARTKAIIDNKDYYFRIYRSDNIYKVDNDRDNDFIIYYKNEEDQEIIIKEGEFSGELKLYKNLNPKLIMSDYYDRLKFKPEGTASNGTIGLKNNNEIMKQVVVSQLGRVRIEE